MKAKLDNNLIKRLYCEDKLPPKQVADQLNSHPETIKYRLRKMGCLRTKSEAERLSWETGRRSYRRELYPKGGKVISSGGYIRIRQPDYPRANKDGYIFEHILVWEQIHNKQLPKGWIVHHLNGIKDDNRPSNLLALPSKKHAILIPTLQEEIRKLGIENRQLRRALEDSQMIMYVNEN